MDWYTQGPASASGDWDTQDVNAVKQKLITANHILHQQGVVDAYGHISVRCPGTPSAYLMCGYMAPALVAGAEDLIEYWVAGSDAVRPEAKKGYSERFIHGEIYRMFPDVNCVVHSHAEGVLPYVTSGVPLMPVFHMAGFLGNDVPVFDIGTVYHPGEQQDLLVRNSRLGTALASKFVKDDESRQSPKTPDHAVVLMRGHGYTTHGRNIETAVYRAIYTKVNAGVQTNAMLLRSALPLFAPTVEPKFDFQPLTDEMCRGCLKMNEGTQDKPWKLWEAEVKTSSLYSNQN